MCIGFSKKVFRQKWANTQVAALSPFLTDEDIESACNDCDHKWRNRIFPPQATIRSMIFRALNPSKSIQNTVMNLVADGSLKQNISKSAWDQARSRLPRELIPNLVRATCSKTSSLFPNKWKGKDVFLVDGSTFSMPDEPALAEEFTYSGSKHGPSKFPIGKILAVMHAGSRNIFDYRIGPFRKSELSMFREIMAELPSNSIWIGDRHFSSYQEFATSKELDIDYVSRLHQARNGEKLAQSGKRLGKNDWIITFTHKNPVYNSVTNEQLDSELQLRLIKYIYKPSKKKKTVFWFVTSLMDSEKYRKQEIIDLYGSRWGIEVHFRYLKITLQMDILRSKTVANIESELATILLTHNLLWRLMLEASQAEKIPIDQLSFTAALSAVLAYSPRMRFSSLPMRSKSYYELLYFIGLNKIKLRAGRHEIRLCKREKKQFPIMRKERWEYELAA